MSDINLTLVATPFTPDPLWTVEQFHQAVVESITSASSGAAVITGRVGGSMPGSDIGPWLNNGTWYYHNGSTYVPAIMKIGDPFFTITLAGAPTSNRTLTFPDKDGTVALTSDVFDGRGTAVPTAGATTSILWSIADSFSVPLSQNTTFANVDSLPGQEVTIGIYNPASWTITWPAEVKWGTVGAPVAPTTGNVHLVRLWNTGGVIYGHLEVNNAS